MLNVTSTATAALAILAIANVAACSKRESPPLAELPPSESPAHPSPVVPVENGQVQGELAAIGAIQTVRGWTLPITDAKFSADRLSLGPTDRTIDNVATALRRRPRLRVLIEAHVEEASSKDHAGKNSTVDAQDVLRALTAKGVAADQMQSSDQANAFTDIPEEPGIILIFSDAEGRFAAAAHAAQN